MTVTIAWTPRPTAMIVTAQYYCPQACFLTTTLESCGCVSVLQTLMSTGYGYEDLRLFLNANLANDILQQVRIRLSDCNLVQCL